MASGRLVFISSFEIGSMVSDASFFIGFNSHLIGPKLSHVPSCMCIGWSFSGDPEIFTSTLIFPFSSTIAAVPVSPELFCVARFTRTVLFKISSIDSLFFGVVFPLNAIIATTATIMIPKSVQKRVDIFILKDFLCDL